MNFSRLRHFLACIGFLFLSGAAQTPSRPVNPIALQSETFPFKPQEFFIADVVDERKNRKSIGNLIVDNVAPQMVDLQGGASVAVKQFLRNGLPHNTALRPIIVHIKEYQITETITAGNRAEGNIKIVLAFSFVRDGKRIKLIDYNGGGRYSRLVNQINVVEPMLRKALVNGLTFFNTWVNREANNEKLATSVKVTLSDFSRKHDPDTVFYADRALLTWNDFQGTPRASRNAAVVFPGFAYEASRRVVNGVVHIKLDIKVYMVKIASWVTGPARNAYGLNHEQRHFDIVMVAAERFKQRVKAEKLSVQDYDNILAFHFFNTLQEIKVMQEKYDEETRHSLDTGEQGRWDRYIDEQLIALAVKNR